MAERKRGSQRERKNEGTHSEKEKEKKVLHTHSKRTRRMCGGGSRFCRERGLGRECRGNIVGNVLLLILGWGGGGVRICQTLFGHVIGGPLSSGSVHAQIAGCEIGKL